MAHDERGPAPADRGDADATREPGVPPHQPAFDPERGDLVDEELEESFPSSDPPASGSPGLAG